MFYLKQILVKLNFTSPVHFGSRRLSDGEMTIKADTLFSALYIEALQLSLDTKLLLEDLVLTDTFPFDEKTYYLPKPLLMIHSSKLENTDFKQFKKLQYIPFDLYEDFIEGKITSDQAKVLNDQFDIGSYHFTLKVTAVDDAMAKDVVAEPFSIGTFSFRKGTGLYFVAKGTSEALKALETILHSLQYSGLGGKRSTGYGRFSFEVFENDEFLTFLQRRGSRNILLSTAMAKEEEMHSLEGDHRFILQKRSGFIQSFTYSDRIMKKRDFYSFCSGSAFEKQFEGGIFDVSNGGNHPVYRYAKAFWLEV